MMNKQGGAMPFSDKNVMDVAVTSNVAILPNRINLIKTDLPVCRAENLAELSGKFLYQQLYSSLEDGLECLLCHKTFLGTDQQPSLIVHYREVHQIIAVDSVAEFSEDEVFIRALPSSEYKILDHKCEFCKVMLKDLTKTRQHYSEVHKKIIKVVLLAEVQKLHNYFYCSVCLYPSSDFRLHAQHMESAHSLKTNLCQFCLYCTPCEGTLHKHVDELHACPVCTEDVHEDMTEHILKMHASQLGDGLWVCKVCGMKFKTVDVLSVHMKICKKLCGCNKVVYKCQSCFLTYPSGQKVFVMSVGEEHESDLAVKKVQVMQEEKCEGLGKEDVGHSKLESPAGIGSDVKVTEVTGTSNVMEDTEEQRQEIDKFHLICAGCLNAFCSEDDFMRHQCP